MEGHEIARKYLSKYHNSIDDGKEFSLSIVSFSNLMNARKCFYSGIEMTDKRSGMVQRATDRTIDRVDRAKGYVKGNVVACCFAANKFKGAVENPNLVIDLKSLKKILNLVIKNQNKK